MTDIHYDPERQGREWGILYDGIRVVLRQFGEEEFRGRADYWVLDDNWGALQHKVYVNSLRLLDPGIVRLLQKVLVGYPEWEIVLAVAVRGQGDAWPDMELIVRADSIEDHLQKSYFPPPYRDYVYFV